jgi:CRISPR-associated protein Cas2
MMFYLVSYDIPDDKKRTRMAKTLRDFGERVQLSVFECILDDILFKRMISRVSKIISEDDSVRVYGLCAKCQEAVKVFGRGMVTKDENVFIL